MQYGQIEKDTLIDYKKSNRKLLESSDIDTLYRQNYRMLLKLVKKYNYTDIDNFDDIIGLANVAFCTAVKHYDHSKNIEFSTYLGVHVKDAFHKYRRFNRARKRYNKDIIIESLDRTIAGNEKDLYVQEAIADYTINIERTVVSDAYYQSFMAYLAKQKRGDIYIQVLQLRIAGIKQKEIGVILGLSQAQICKILKKCGNLMMLYNKQKGHRYYG